MPDEAVASEPPSGAVEAEAVPALQTSYEALAIPPTLDEAVPQPQDEAVPLVLHMETHDP